MSSSAGSNFGSGFQGIHHNLASSSSISSYSAAAVAKLSSGAKRSQWKPPDESPFQQTSSQVMTPSNCGPTMTSQGDKLYSKHDLYLLQLEEKTRVKKQLLLEKNESEKAMNEKEQGFVLYVNGANTSRDTRTNSSKTSESTVRKSQFPPPGSLRRSSKDAAIGQHDYDPAQRAQTAPSKRKKWGQDGEIEILTHREGRMKFDGSVYQHKYSEDFENESDPSAEQDSGSEDVGGDMSGDSNSCGEGSNRAEVVFEKEEVEMLRQSLKLDEILRESIEEELMNETPSDCDEDEIVKRSVVIDFSHCKTSNSSSPKVLKSGPSESSRSLYTPTKHLYPVTVTENSNSLDCLLKGDNIRKPAKSGTPLEGHSELKKDRSVRRSASRSGNRDTDTDDESSGIGMSSSATHEDSLEGPKMNQSSSSHSSCDLLAKSDLDINEVVQKFKKLDFEQKRLLLAALTQESSEDKNDGEILLTASCEESKWPRDSKNLEPQCGFSPLQMSEKSAFKNCESFDFESSKKVARMSNKTYRADEARASNGGGEISGFQKLVKSTSGEYAVENVDMELNDNDDDVNDDDKTPRGTEDKEKDEKTAVVTTDVKPPQNHPKLILESLSRSSITESAKRHKTQTRNSSHQNSMLFPTFPSDIDKNACSLNEPSHKGDSTFRTVGLKLLSNWGDDSEIGLTEVQFFDRDEKIIKCQKCSVINAMEQRNGIKVLVNGKAKTTKLANMWSCMYTKYPVELLFTLPAESELASVKIWNYNRSVKALAKGTRNLEIRVDNRILWKGELEKGCGSQIFDYEKVIPIDCSQLQPPSLSTSSIISRKSEDSGLGKVWNQAATVGARSLDIPSEVPILDCGKPLESRTECEDMEIRDSVDGSLSLEKLLAESFGKSRSATQINEINNPNKPLGLYPKKASSARSARKLLNISGMFDSLDLSTNEEVHYEPTPHESAAFETATDKIGDTSPKMLLDCNAKLDESWSHIFAFERATSGRRASSDKDFTRTEILKPIEETSSSNLSIRSFSPPVDPKSCRLEDPRLLSMQSFDWSNFVIPELPFGSKLTINILSTWGDRHYVGLNGIELYDDLGKPIRVASIEADPPDINVLPEYSKDPRVVTNLIDGVNNTRDDTHMWLTPFSANENHFVFVTFKQSYKVAMLRIWNYNKSRVHSSRGAKLVSVFLDDNPIFHGEIERASELGENGKETYGDTIMFTMDENILCSISENDELFLNDWRQSFNCDELARPMTAGETCDDARPITVASNQKPEQMLAEHSAVKLSAKKANQNLSKSAKFKIVQLNFTDTWSDSFYLGLTGLQLLTSSGKNIDLTLDMLEADPNDLNCLPEYSKDVRTLDKLIDGENITTDDCHMWLIPFTKGSGHTLTIKVPSDSPEVSEIRIWNYNKSWEDAFRGAKNMQVLVDGVQKSPIEGFTLRKAPGHTNYNFFQSIYLDRALASKNMETLSCPCGFVYTLLIQSNQGDPYYVGLDGIELLDENCQKLNGSLLRVDAYPRSVNVLENVKNDVRTPEKMIDGVNNARDGTHSWLAPIFPNIANKVYILFNSPQSVSKIKVWNYSKTASRGIKEVAILVDDLIQHQAVLKPAFNVARGIIPGLDSEPQFQTIDLRSDQIGIVDETDASGGLPSFGGGGGGGPDSVKVHQTATGSNKEANQMFRPKTCVAKKK